MTLIPLCTFFSRAGCQAAQGDRLTVTDWRWHARSIGRSSWEGAARVEAQRVGGAIVMRADDALVVFTRRAGGRVERRTYRPGKWAWAD